jgi:hypothetical protein
MTRSDSVWLHAIGYNDLIVCLQSGVLPPFIRFIESEVSGWNWLRIQPACENARESDLRATLIDAWDLVSYRRFRDGGFYRETMGAGATGRIIYSGSGYMSAFLLSASWREQRGNP